MVDSPDFVTEDHALLLGLDTYEKSLCPGCGISRDIAWHADMDGWFEVTNVKCHACTAKGGDPKHPTIYAIPHDSRPEPEPLSPLVIGLTTASS